MASILTKAWQVDAIRKGEFFGSVDFMCIRQGKVVAVFEYKRRNNPYHQYPTVFLSVRKYEAIVLHAKYHNATGLFVWEYDDGIWYAVLSDEMKADIKICGRFDRGYRQDVEAMILYKTDWLRKVKIDG